MKENVFQARVIKRLREEFPDCIVLKNDPTYIQGFPDLLVLKGNRWAALECKRDICSSFQPNQQYYINQLNNMSYASVIFPENEDRVFGDLHLALEFDIWHNVIPAVD